MDSRTEECPPQIHASDQDAPVDPLGPAAAAHADIRVDGARMLAVLRGLSDHGRDPDGGITRLGFTPEDDAARQYLRQLAAEAGLLAEVDQAGNLLVRRRAAGSERPVLLMGSHIDTVPRGGALDGAYGVAAAFEVLRVLTEHDVPTRYEPVVVAFANEEGARFPVPFWGSLALTGQLTDPTAAVDRQGCSLREPLARAGGDLDAVARAAWAPGSVGVYLEIHIEQGPVLEANHVPIGVVDGIVGRTMVEFTVHGEQMHAGTTPMEQRCDALVTAAQLVLAIKGIAKDEKLCAVSTVGILQVQPGQTNVVPGLVTMSAEIRDGDMDRLRAAEAALCAEADRIARSCGTRIEARTTMRSDAVSTAAPVREAIRAAAEQLALPCLPMYSGAGHDAQIVAALAPVGMIFVPSRRGISHAPQEYTAPEDLVTGADVLLRTALQF
ncbi:Zn-dependent hydrolase [Kitasatospora sp. LaBMicrA B282]|uniref:Zn-dependent hydrolase n=1 Tax=Kitasatospora sp. LaBMicrA B282 TaxID=3420949 RepID=UPI003D125D73